MSDGDQHRADEEPAGLAPAAMARARAAALEELRRQPRAVPWRRHAIGIMLAVLGTTALVLGLGSWFSIVEIDRLSGRLALVALLVPCKGWGFTPPSRPGKICCVGSSRCWR